MGPSVGPPLGDSWFAFAAGVIVLALVSGRLLGVHISWPRRLLAALFGLIAGTIVYYLTSMRLTTAINPGLGFVLTALLTTMILLVLLELLARPGTRAGRGRGFRPPRPVRALRRAVENARRYLQIVWIGARNGLGPELRAGSRPRRLGRRLRLTLEQTGGAFVKLGQVLSTRGDLLPAELVAELARLQDDVASAPAEAVAALLAEELGAPPVEVFAEFEVRPIAAASIAQVHLARLCSGEGVVVKVQPPGVRTLIERDLEIMLRLARRLEAGMAWASDIGVGQLAEGFAGALREELDFQIERGNLEAIAPGHLRDALIELAPVHDVLAEERLEQALGQFMARRLAPGMMSGAAMFGDLFRLLTEFGLVLPPQVAAVFRAVVTLEGTLRLLTPGFELIQEARPFAAEVVQETLRADSLPGELATQLPLLRRLPRRVDQLAAMAAGPGLAIRVSLFEGEHDRALAARLVDRALLAFVGAVLGGLAIGLLATPGSPMVAPWVSVLQVLGYPTLVASAILLLRVLVAVVRDGLA
jgi:predicted unusual protein kinase regulating ubiquinone biosynthesis (AarF/ABC1/UbiB family)